LEVLGNSLFLQEFAEYSGGKLKVKAVLTVRCPTCGLLVEYAVGSALAGSVRLRIAAGAWSRRTIPKATHYRQNPQSLATIA
jgi:hypothetical protein